MYRWSLQRAAPETPSPVIRGYAGKDPLVEYEKEAHKLFAAVMDRIEDDAVRYLFLAQVGSDAAPVPGVLKRCWNFLARQRNPKNG
jgi:preprotein translocase subunit SecA